jgi:hypothetical protein
MQSALPRRDPTREAQDLSQEELWHKRPAGRPSLVHFWNHTKKRKKKKELHGGVASKECEVSGRWQPFVHPCFLSSRFKVETRAATYEPNLCSQERRVWPTFANITDNPNN